jgi:hypothetical protein
MAVEKARTTRKLLFVLVPMVIVLLIAMLTMIACSNDSENGGDDGTMVSDNNGGSISAADLSCTACHDDTSLISGKKAAWAESLHGSGEARAYAGGRATCAGCHSGGAFSMAIAAGEKPGEYEAGDPNPSGQDCRACHQIHSTYTADDWALETTDPVELYAIEGATFDGGEGNLCANCHQPRRDFPVAENGVITGISTHWGPHHGPQAGMMLGVAGPVQGQPSMHYSMVEDTCVTCHLGEGESHTFEPAVAACVSCHADAEDFDIEGVQTEVQERLDTIGEALVAAGALTENTVDGHATETAIADGLDENLATALYVWIYIAHEDKSLGVHNPGYTMDLLDAADAALQGGSSGGGGM